MRKNTKHSCESMQCVPSMVTITTVHLRPLFPSRSLSPSLSPPLPVRRCSEILPNSEIDFLVCSRGRIPVSSYSFCGQRAKQWFQNVSCKKNTIIYVFFLLSSFAFVFYFPLGKSILNSQGNFWHLVYLMYFKTFNIWHSNNCIPCWKNLWNDLIIEKYNNLTIFPFTLVYPFFHFQFFFIFFLFTHAKSR